MISEPMLALMLRRAVIEGRLKVRFPSGLIREYGRGEPVVAIEICTTQALRKLLFDPGCAIPDLYINGDIRVTHGSVYDVAALCFRNLERVSNTGFTPLRKSVRRTIQSLTGSTSAFHSARNARHHYDIDERIYRLFLDDDLQYSCAYFSRPNMALEDAQEEKKQRLIAKLLMTNGMRVLDIGCGWGGLALSIASAYPSASILGVTLSPRQLALARARAAEAGVADRVDFQLKDYRELTGSFDRIISVGMFEHVGPGDYRRFFRKIRSLLGADGVALLHTIGRSGPPAPTSPWIRKHIFPGGHIPAFSEIAPAIESEGLVMGDVEVLRLHYAETLRHWRRRFAAKRDKAAIILSEEFCRTWEFYLAASEASFRFLDHVVFQIQLLGSNRASPLTRDYMLHTPSYRQPAMAHA